MVNKYTFNGSRIRRKRLHRGLTIDEFAVAIGISAPFLGQIERGERKPSLETFERILAVLDVSPQALMLEASRKPRLEDRFVLLMHGQPKARKQLVFAVVKCILRLLPRA